MTALGFGVLVAGRRGGRDGCRQGVARGVVSHVAVRACQQVVGGSDRRVQRVEGRLMGFEGLRELVSSDVETQGVSRGRQRADRGVQVIGARVQVAGVDAGDAGAQLGVVPRVGGVALVGAQQSGDRSD